MRSNRSRGRRLGIGLAAAAFAAVGLGTAGIAPAGAAKVKAQAVPVGQATYGGYGSGAVNYLNALQPVGPLALVQTAIANGAVNSQGLKETKNELGRLVQPGTAGKNSGANGRALEVAVAGAPINLAPTAVAEAAPSTQLADVNLLTLPVSTVAYAQALNGQAQARWQANECILGADLSYSRGQAAKAQALGGGSNPDGTLVNPTLATQDPSAERSVVWSQTRQRLVAQTDRAGKVVGGDFGLLTEVRQTLVPTTLRLSNQVVVDIEVAGSYTLRSFAGGLPGTGFVTFNPEADFKAPVVRITVPKTSPIFGAVDPLLPNTPDGSAQLLVNFQDLAPVTGPVSAALAALGIELKIAEPPRAIGDPSKPAVQAADGTAAAGALDVVRLRTTGPLAGVEDFRLGHAEATAAVPAGGIQCPGLNVAKSTDKDPVVSGDTFTYTITVTNPYDCPLTNVKLVDTVSADPGIAFTIGATNPTASSVSGNTITWNDIGPIPPRGSKSVTAAITVTKANAAGRIIDKAVATADCAVGDATGKQNVKVNIRGEVILAAPNVNAGDRARGALPRTGGDDGRLAAIGGLLLVGLAIVETLRRRSASSA